MTASKLTVLAPLRGWSTPLDEAPDEVFAARMLGDGVAIDPTDGTLYAPCDGTLIVVPASKHAVTLRAANGAEILVHVGIDTVGLGGEGFDLHAREGEVVRAGDRLISFDLDLLAQRAKSLLTPVIVTNGEKFQVSRPVIQRAVEVGDHLFEVSLASGSAAATPVTSGAKSVSQEVSVSLEHGIHARPAAVLAGSVRPLAAQVSIAAGSRKANARSPVALMSLGVRKGDVVTIEASGSDAEEAVAVLKRALGGSVAPAPGTAASARESGAAPKANPPVSTVASPAPPVSTVASAAPPVSAAASAALPATEVSFRGVVASRGLAVGQAFQFARASIEVSEAGEGVTHESAELDRALDHVRNELLKSVQSGGGAAGEVAAAHLELLDDPELLAGARELIGSGKGAAFAWRTVLRSSSDALRALGDPRMAERADDLFDLESRVLAALTGQVAAMPTLPADAILLANELLPSQLSALDTARLAGICLAAGGPTSHVAIIAAAMDVPALVAAGPGVLRIASGTPLVLDAELGWLHRDPPSSQLDEARKQVANRRARRAAEQSAAHRESRTADGVRIEAFANVGSVSEARVAARNGAEGCGLLRTEFLFLERQSPPGEAEQLDQYQQIASELQNRPITIRTLDIGGDKPIPYLPLPHEENPALGLRGVRTSLWRPDLLRIQLRAILRVRPIGQCRILLPMITEPGEIRTVRLMLDELRAELDYREPVVLGAMIETPASAMMADRIAREADFLSVGTNDLTQYTLAMDRGHSELAARLDGLHPSVLRLIQRTAEAARAQGRSVAVCGGLASDPVAVPILIGLGVHELSVVPAAIPQLKAQIAHLTIDDCTGLALRALECETAEAVRALSLRSVPGAAGRTAESP